MASFNWPPLSTSGTGTVTSVGLTNTSDPLYVVTGSPVTGSGVINLGIQTQAANLVFSGPTTGSAAIPSFRALVGADLPNPGASSLGGVQSKAVVASNFLTGISTSGVPSAAQPALTDLSGIGTPTGTGNIVLSASPTLTGTLTAGAANFSGAVTTNTASTGAGGQINIKGDPTNGSQVLYGSASNSQWGSVGTRFSGGEAFLSFNAYQDALSTDHWAQNASSSASAILFLSTTGLHLRKAASSTAAATFATFFGSDIFSVNASGNAVVTGTLGVTGNSTFSGTVTNEIDQNANTTLNVSNQTSGTSAAAKVQVKSLSSSGYIGAFDSANTDIPAFADRMVLDTNSDAAGLTLSTGTAGQDLQIRSGARILGMTLDSSQVLNFNVAANEVTPANVQTATLGTTTPVAFGSTSPSKWLKIKLSDGNSYYLPLWK